MTDTITEPSTSTAESTSTARPKGLSAMLMPELRQRAAELGVSSSGLRKAELIAAIRTAQGGGTDSSSGRGKSDKGKDQKRNGRAATASSGQQADTDSATASEDAERQHKAEGEQGSRRQANAESRNGRGRTESRPEGKQAPAEDDERGKERGERNGDGRRNNDGQRGRDGSREDGRNNDGQRGRDGSREDGRNNDGNERGNRRRRDRNRGRNRDRNRNSEPQISEDDVLLPAAGILDIKDNYAFVRTTGYLPSPNDLYVAMSLVKRHNLRKGDAITGAVRQPSEHGKREKYNPLVRIDTVNGAPLAESAERADFGKLTPLYPQQRLRLETESANYTTRVVDIVAPIGKGQRGLIVSPPKAGKTMVLQAIANAITENNPECHLMVVLVDERPEEVTDMQRSVKGEVIASTFDRPAEDHTTVAELAIERAKRLVELGHDVVVLLDSMTRLGRAYNLAAPASGRILSGGVDSAALYPPKRFFGAARNIENGGSLTILATALVETGSKMDEVIFEEFKGTGNMELKLDRRIADKRIFPAIDVDASGTRKEELLMGGEKLKIVWKLRRVLHALEPLQGIELLLSKLRETKSNYEFLLQVQKTSPSANGDE